MFSRNREYFLKINKKKRHFKTLLLFSKLILFFLGFLFLYEGERKRLGKFW